MQCTSQTCGAVAYQQAKLLLAAGGNRAARRVCHWQVMMGRAGYTDHQQQAGETPMEGHRGLAATSPTVWAA